MSLQSVICTHAQGHRLSPYNLISLNEGLLTHREGVGGVVALLGAGGICASRPISELLHKEGRGRGTETPLTLVRRRAESLVTEEAERRVFTWQMTARGSRRQRKPELRAGLTINWQRKKKNDIIAWAVRAL